MALRLFYILTLLFLSNLASGQRNKLKNTDIDTSTIYSNPNCSYNLTYDANQRRSLFPFNSASEIWLLSFPFSTEKVIDYLSFNRMSFKNEGYIEVVQLTENAIDSLSDILYNQVYSSKKDSLNGRPVYHVWSEKGCYMPRNAIVFLDTNAEPFAFIEICFECENYKVSSEEINVGEFCIQKYNLLKQFFYTRGINYGTQQH